MARLAHIFRHPIKSHGREEMAEVTLIAGQGLPWDRRWAVTHDRSKWQADRPRWMACANFLIGSGNPRIMAIDATVDEAAGTVRLTHPDRTPIVVDPDDPGDAARFLDWIAPLTRDGRAATGLARAPGRGMTDTDYPSVSVCNLASNAALGVALGADLAPQRWRGNLWIAGWEPWAENGLAGRGLRIGPAELRLRERIVRCKATSANPVTGVLDVDTLAGLRATTGAQDFGLYAEVVTGGTIRPGDAVALL